MLDIVLESIRAIVGIAIFAYFVALGRQRPQTFERGWGIVVAGFGLLAFGSVVDITDNFESLNRFVVVGDTEAQALLEKIGGYLLGTMAVAVGFWRWLPWVGSAIADGDHAREDLDVAEARFRAFFESSLSATFIEDHSSLGRWFEDLRADGVDDLGRYLDDHPGEVAAQVRELRVLEANQAAADTFGDGQRAQMSSYHQHQRLGDGSLDTFRTQFTDMWDDRSYVELDMIAEAKNGREFAALLQYVVPVVEGERDLSRVMVTITDTSRQQALINELSVKHTELSDALADLTKAQQTLRHRYESEARVAAELANMQQELIEARKSESIGSLAAGIAHEINTPTQYVGDNLRFFQECLEDFSSSHCAAEALATAADTHGVLGTEAASYRAAGDSASIEFSFSEAPEAIKEALEGVDRIASIVRAMKDFSHPGSDAHPPVDINRALEATITVARSEWSSVAEVQTDLDPALPLVPASVGQLNQVFLNLIVNAAHAIADGDSTTTKGTISVSTRMDGNTVQITVADTGCGIAPEIRQRIFDPFFTTKEPGRGTGQGLAIAHAVVVDRHGGLLSVESDPGLGTTFTVTLQVAPSQDDDGSAEDCPVGQVSGQRIP